MAQVQLPPRALNVIQPDEALVIGRFVGLSPSPRHHWAPPLSPHVNVDSRRAGPGVIDLNVCV